MPTILPSLQQRLPSELLAHVDQTFAMYKPDECRAILEIVNRSIIDSDDPDQKKQRRKIQMGMVDGEALQRYALHYLSDSSYLSLQTREEKQGFWEFSSRARTLGDTEEATQTLYDAIKLIENNQHLSKTFGVIADIAYQYFHDVNAVAKTISNDHDGKIKGAAAEMLSEAGVGFFTRELLVYMFFGLSKEVRGVNSIQGIFEKALNNAKGKGVFRIKGTCPFGSQISSLLDVAPRRDPKTGKVNVVGSEPCALPTFVFNDILDSLAMDPIEQLRAKMRT